VTVPTPGPAGPAGAPATGAGRGDLRETYLSPATAVGRPPWDEIPRSLALAPRPEAPRAPSPPEHHQEAAAGHKARPGTAVPAHHSPPRGPAHRRGIAAGGLALLAGVTAPVGLFVPYDGATFWASAQFWSGFAAFCALVQLAPLARPVFGWPARRAWSVGAGGVAGLLVFWVLIVLPVVSSNSSFVVTAAVAAAAGGSWLAAGRPDLSRAARPPVTNRERPAGGR
jgi:hypothetical protein